MYSPYESELEVWPSPIAVQQVLPKVNMIPELEQRKNMVNQESFLSQRIVKLHDEKMSYFDKRMDAFAMTTLYAQGALSSLSSSMVALPPLTMVIPKVMPRTGTKDIVQLDVNNMDPMKRQQWIMEMMKKKNNNNPQAHVGGNEMMFKFDSNINPNKCH
ncbi:hypothetical protein Golob_023221 [Gossypium lobatum]|uniref:Uncharacterized protein n=1 Tax=Gossypium lobatum TaxID=34289 RepID=A0A7J8LIY1_9ROSI|nr:hypothetical protein [Gossypium lobatum]